MTRKAVLLGVAIALFLAAAGTAFAVLVRHEPAFYRLTARPPGRDRWRMSEKFKGEAVAFYNNLHGPSPHETEFTDELINSFLEEGFITSNVAKLLPEDIRDPRVAIQPDKVRLAFRYGKGLWSTIISIDLRVWLPKSEENVVALELKGLHAGSLPISAQSLLERVSETARQQNLDVTWYRYDGNPVALLRFQADQRSPTFRLRKLELHPGKIVISGQAIDTAVRAYLPSGLQPAAN
jgi:hypothetical protein